MSEKREIIENCNNIKSRMRHLNSMQEKMETEISSIDKEISKIEQETKESYREFLLIASRAESAKIPLPSNITNNFLDMTIGVVIGSNTPDSYDEYTAWKKYENIKSQNDNKIEDIKEKRQRLISEYRENSVEISELGTKYSYLDCARISREEN